MQNNKFSESIISGILLRSRLIDLPYNIMKKLSQNITHRDFITIYYGSMLMAHIDSALAPREKDFLLELADLGHINNKEIDQLNKANKDDIFKMIDSLSSERARKVFILAIATMALADNVLAKEEIQFLEILSKQLNVGTVRIDNLTYDKSQQMVLKMLNSVS
ncbi:MAG: TerB family tellurite resistance protein [Proteobacteria bacterium]|nr:TerB family tellurite resistance protein [Pseudomonadota bacterium]